MILAVDPLGQFVGPLAVGGVVMGGVFVYVFIRFFLPIIFRQ